MTLTELISAYWPTLLFYSVMAAIIIGVVGFIRGSREPKFEHKEYSMRVGESNPEYEAKIAEAESARTGKPMTEGRPISKVEMFDCARCGSVSWSALPTVTPDTDVCWICDPVAWGLEPRIPDIPEDLQTLLDAQSKGIQAIIESDVSEKHKIALVIKKKDAARKRALSRKQREKVILQIANTSLKAWKNTHK